MSVTLIPADGLHRVPWLNGGGTSRTIATGLDAAGAMLWQVGIADLERDGPFSHYAGFDRVFTPIAGDPPPELAFHGGPFEPCPLLVPKPFPGDVPTLSRVPSPGQAFNAIVDRRRHAATVTVLHLRPGDGIDLPAADAVLHCLTATVTLGAHTARPGDSLHATTAGRATAETPGIALLAVIAAR